MSVSSLPQGLAPVGPHGPRLNARIGRIKVIGANSADFGYLGDGQTVYTAGIGAGASATEAIRVNYIPANSLYEIEIQVGHHYSPHRRNADIISTSEVMGRLKHWVCTGVNRHRPWHLALQSMSNAMPGPCKSLRR